MSKLDDAYTFVLNDAVIISKKIKPSPVVVVPPVKLTAPVG
jgi:hypothetical protein